MVSLLMHVVGYIKGRECFFLEMCMRNHCFHPNPLFEVSTVTVELGVVVYNCQGALLKSVPLRSWISHLGHIAIC